jgi:hypothetical protein
VGKVKAVEVNAALDQRMRTWLATALGASATWRQDKAAQYPDDRRNVTSMTALSSAAAYVRHKPGGGGIFHMVQLFAACEELEYDLVTYPGPKSERVAGRYGFDRVTPPLDDASHDLLLNEIFLASLEDLREELEDDVPEGSRLAKLFAEFLPARPVSIEETSIALLTEIRDLLRDRLPVAVETQGET